jgi:hypothetical protein
MVFFHHDTHTPFLHLYPNSVRPSHGIFVETLLRHLLASGQVAPPKKNGVRPEWR